MSRPTNTQFAVGVHVLTLLCDASAGPVSSDAMTTSVNANPVYVRRVLGLLRRAGLVASRPGARGGWALERNPADIRLGDVWRAVQGEDPVFALHTTNPSCPVGRDVQASLVSLERRSAHALEAELDATTIADVLRDARVAPVPR